MNEFRGTPIEHALSDPTFAELTVTAPYLFGDELGDASTIWSREEYGGKARKLTNGGGENAKTVPHSEFSAREGNEDEQNISMSSQAYIDKSPPIICVQKASHAKGWKNKQPYKVVYVQFSKLDSDLIHKVSDPVVTMRRPKGEWGHWAVKEHRQEMREMKCTEIERLQIGRASCRERV